MICIVGDRQSGKTTALIEMSARTQIPIFAPTRAMARSVLRRAWDMGMPIPEPVTFDERRVTGRRKVMIDEVQAILESQFGIEVVCATFNKDSVDLSSVTLFELLGMWWRQRRANDVSPD